MKTEIVRFKQYVNKNLTEKRNARFSPTSSGFRSFLLAIYSKRLKKGGRVSASNAASKAVNLFRHLLDSDDVCVGNAGKKGLGLFSKKKLRVGKSLFANTARLADGSEDSLGDVERRGKWFVVQGSGYLTNHSCKANLTMISKGSSKRYPTIYFKTLDNIAPFTQLTFDYGDVSAFGCDPGCEMKSHKSG
jgi:hypothetical protein